jgi:mercuric ion binding protein
MKKIILLSLVFSSLALAQALLQEIKVGVKGMVCAFCAQGIEKNFLKHPEVSKIEVSLENKFVKIKFKDGQSMPKEKIAQILKEAGYESVFGD